MHKKLEKEAKEFGWNASDYHPETLVFVCPWWDEVGRAAAAGVLAFLGNPKRWYRDAAHGFAIVPGSVDLRDMKGSLFLHKGRDENGYEIFDQVPRELDQLLFVDDDNVPRGDWYYTVNSPRGWTPRHEINCEYVDGKLEYFS